jgi:hypothetical protein
LQWHDEAKRQILLDAISKKMMNALVGRGIPPTFHGMIDRLHEISTDLDTGLLHRKEKPYRGPNQRPATVEQTYEPMDWTPTQAITVNRVYSQPDQQRNSPDSVHPRDRDLIGKRARWVPPSEIERRRLEGRCFRCGRRGCEIQQCPLLPARPPKNAQPRSRVSTTTMEESTRAIPEKKRRPRVTNASRPKVEVESDEAEYTSTSEDSSGKE